MVGLVGVNWWDLFREVSVWERYVSVMVLSVKWLQDSD